MANLPVPANLSEADYDAIEGAVMETARGRWFLAEYARRNRHADTTMLLKALDRIEGAMRGEHSVEPVERIRFDLVEMSRAIARTKAEIASIKPEIDHHGKFGEASEELPIDYRGEAMEVGFNARYLLDVLSVLPEGTKVEIGLGDELSPGVLRGDDEGYRYVVMPMRI